MDDKARSPLARITGALPRREAIAVYFASGLAAVGVGTAASREWPGPLIEAFTAPLVSVLPDTVLASAILTLQDLGRPVLALGALVAVVTLFAAIPAVITATRGRRSRADAVLGTGMGQAVAALLITLNPLVGFGAGVGGVIAFTVAGAGVTATNDSPQRRKMLRSVAVAAGSVGIAWASIDRVTPLPDDELDDPAVQAMLAAADDREFDLPGAEQLRSRDFFAVDINTSTPVLDRDEWELRIAGDGAAEPFFIDYEELTSREAEHRFVTLRCVSDQINGDLTDTALWTGVPIAPLLEEADAPEECCVRLEAHDGYYHGFPREALERGFLAWRMDGKLLPRAHGHPVRALIPGHWGEINVKWLTDIEIRDEPAESYWGQQGWHGDGPVSTVAKVHSVTATDDDDRVRVGGHAYAGTRGVSGVEVSVDGGDTWDEAELTDPLPGSVTPNDDPTSVADLEGRAADAWRQWRYEYPVDEPHEVVVRAVESDGTVQPREETDPYPEGASGWVRRDIDPATL